MSLFALCLKNSINNIVLHKTKKSHIKDSFCNTALASISS